ncbi:MAG: hypothetical protein R2942_14015 [Ignavibacteria bacterium]
MVVGVNGVGKTTSIGKLAYNFKNAGKSVLIGSADTFRVAANDQLGYLGKESTVLRSFRVTVPLIRRL